MVQIAIGYTSNLDCALDQDALDSQSHLPKDYTHMEGPSGMIFFTSAVQVRSFPLSREADMTTDALLLSLLLHDVQLQMLTGNIWCHGS